MTTHHRKHAIRLLNGPAPGAARPPRRRDTRYGVAATDALHGIWKVTGHIE